MEAEIKRELFYAFKELHTVERLNKMKLTSFSSFRNYSVELKHDIASLITELAILYGEVANKTQILLWDSLLQDENLSRTQRVVADIYYETKNFIEQQWKSVV